MADISVQELTDELREAIAQIKSAGTTDNVGVVTRIGDGIAWIYGLTDCAYNEMIEIEGESGKTTAFALNLMEDEIGAVLLGEDVGVKAGDKVRLTGKVLEIPIGEELVGRVVLSTGSHD